MNTETKKETCPKCGTADCITDEEYRSHIKIVGAGVLEVPSDIIMKCCKTRRTLNKIRSGTFLTR